MADLRAAQLMCRLLIALHPLIIAETASQTEARKNTTTNAQNARGLVSLATDFRPVRGKFPETPDLITENARTIAAANFRIAIVLKCGLAFGQREIDKLHSFSRPRQNSPKLHLPNVDA